MVDTPLLDYTREQARAIPHIVHRTVALMQLDGMSRHDIAARLGKTYPAIRAIAGRAREAMGLVEDGPRDRPPPSETPTLTPRQAEVAAAFQEGLSSAQVGQRLGISLITVANHRRAAEEVLRMQLDSHATSLDRKLDLAERCPRCSLLMEDGEKKHVCCGRVEDYARSRESANPAEGTGLIAAGRR